MKQMGKLLKLLCSRMVIVGLLIAVQVVWFLVFLFRLTRYSVGINIFFTGLSVIALLFIINRRDNPAYKLAWAVPVLVFPLLGGLLYLMFGTKRPLKGLRNRLDTAKKRLHPDLKQSPGVLEEIQKQDARIAGQVRYLSGIGFPVHKNTQAEYYESGEANFPVFVEELKKAEHFIFMEYFIIEEGVMWNTILDILKEKAAAGLDVRLIYDDVGCLNLLPSNYFKTMEEYGIQCIAFNPFIPIFSVVMNNRDHRKIMVIDGHTAFTGGINLADEYINVKKRLGYWKDTGIMLKGEAVWNLTVMFLETWNGIRPTDTDITCFKPQKWHSGEFESDGFVQPYGDSPLDEETVGENVYLNIINMAERYVYIFTPYLIIDHEMITALCLAAKRGVDVRIVTPNVPDKKIIFWMTQSYYSWLADAGVKIYQFTDGFIHAKCFVCDDEIATVGTINMDFRSLYLHFENGVLLYRNRAVMQVKKDAVDTIERSTPLSVEMVRKRPFVRLLQAVLRLFAPLM